ncbi:recombinase [Histophilus somni]|uniref:recombinase RecT n=1 Tax=Histophilus somni TaxID=731 RepID=UPI0010434E3C|nr:recombinase RecT [Histophilus somni]QQF70810.1 recombinase RecT [Histophilus somni]QQF84550.1 recombinase RecT [Histophilus somni]TDF37824.1 recombinase [Histophilus somni]TFF02217.1 recombinase [Histophilus somni]
MTNQTPIAKKKDKHPVKEFFDKSSVKRKLEELVNKNASSFTTSVLQIVNNNSLLKNADPMTVFNAACMAATLQLPLQNGLGFAYIVPYKNNKTGKYDAQFQLGYKGLIQLAQRSGQFKRLVAVPVYEKQLITEDPINGFEFDWKQKPEVGELPIGYYAYFRLLNDFTAELYMTQQEVNEHAKRYSQTYRTYLQKKEKGQWASSVWADNFEAMALKTVMKLLLSKQAPLSVEMQQAVLADQAVVKDVEKAEYSYPDNEIQDAEFTDLKVTDEQFEKCKQNIVNKETTLQDLCDNGFEFSREQYAELEKLENE